MSTIYLLGDILQKGNGLLRKQEADILRKNNLSVYSAIEQKDINNKYAQTAESNNNLAERIVKKDTNAIRSSGIVIADASNTAVGSSVELGQIHEMNFFTDTLRKLLKEDDKALRDGIEKLVDDIPHKEVYVQSTDIRRTDIPETGDRRSWSINQYLYGVILNLTNGKGIEEFDDIVNTILDKENSQSYSSEDDRAFARLSQIVDYAINNTPGEPKFEEITVGRHSKYFYYICVHTLANDYHFNIRYMDGNLYLVKNCDNRILDGFTLISILYGDNSFQHFVEI